LINYVKFLKNTTVKKIYYGAFEKLGYSYVVKKIPVKERFAPVLDLTAFSELQDWTSAANDFTNFGNVNKLTKISKNEMLNDLLLKFSRNFATCRGIDLIEGSTANRLSQTINDIQTNNLSKPFIPIFEEIKFKVEQFKLNEEIKNGLKTVKYCIDHNLTQQGITLLAEFIITYILIIINEDWKNTINRDSVSGCLNINKRELFNLTLLDERLTKKCCEGGLTKEQKNDILSKQAEIADKVFELPFKKKLSNNVYKKLSQGSRNDINHAGIRPDPKEPEYLIDRLKKYYNLTSKIITDYIKPQL
jgi:hypothetical protein